MRNILIILATTSILISGCANKFETRTFDQKSWKPGSESIEGVIYYEPRLMKIQYTFTTLVNDKGVLLGTAEDGKCTPVVQKEEVKVLPDYSKARVLINKPSYWSSGKFTVTLKDGILVSVNSESKQEASEMLTSLLGDSGIKSFAVTPSDKNACNASPIITYFEPLNASST